MTVKEMSFVNHPVLSNGALHTLHGHRAWELSFDALFASSCLADLGVTAHYTDKFDPESGGNGLRILLVQQNASPGGCPDIYQPVRRPFRLEIPLDSNIEQVMLLNYGVPHRSWQSQYQIFLQATASATPAEPNSKQQRVTLRRLSEAVALPPLSNIAAVKSNGRPEYALEFDVTFTDPCSAANGIDALMIESRTDLEPPFHDTVLDWLLVLPRGAQDRCAAGSQSIARRFSLRRANPPNYRRQLLVLNPTLARAAKSELPFGVYDVGAASR